MQRHTISGFRGMTILATGSLLAPALPAPASAQAAPSAAVSPAAAGANAPAAPPGIVFTGEVRTRSELDHPGGAVSGDLFTLLRTRFGARVDAAPGVRMVLQVQDSRVLGAEGHPAARVAESFGLHQAYVELRGGWGGNAMALRAGRQEIAIANERLVGAVAWSNTGRSFDGARFTIARAGTPAGGRPAVDRWSATVFGATVEERGRHFGTAADSAPSRDHVLGGVHTAVALPRGGSLEGTALHDAGGTYRTFTSADRATFDVRLRAPRVAALTLELEGAWQTGHQRDTLLAGRGRQEVRAWMAGARLGTAGRDPAHGTFTIGVDLVSGDATPHDSRHGAFNAIYGSNHLFYGSMDVILEPATSTRDRGLVDAFASATVQAHPRARVRADVHRLRLASGTGRDLGWEADLTVPIVLLPTAGLDLGYSVFRAGRDAASIALGAPGAVRDRMFAQLRVAF